jgi:hypothetical protein
LGQGHLPAEATLPVSPIAPVFHTVILRNIDDRLAAERRIELLSAEAEPVKTSATTPAWVKCLSSAVMKELFESSNASPPRTPLCSSPAKPHRQGTHRALIHDASTRTDSRSCA